MKVAGDAGGRWQRGRWRDQATLVRRHTLEDGALEGSGIRWFWVDGMYPLTVTIEGDFVCAEGGGIRLVTSARNPQLPSETQTKDTDPTTYTEEQGVVFPQVGQTITHPAVVLVAGPVGWIGLHLPLALVSGELSVFVLVSSTAEGG